MSPEPKPAKLSLRDQFRDLRRQYARAGWQFEETAADDTVERNRLLKLMSTILGELDAVASQMTTQSQSLSKKS
jgi:hypothetical protein